MSTQRLVGFFMLTAFSFFAPAWQAFAQVPAAGSSSPTTIQVTGSGLVRMPPGQAELDLGVITRAETAQEAVRENAQRTDEVIRELRAAVGPGGEIATVGYSVTPDYRYPKDGTKPAIIGYSATDLVQVRMRDLSEVGKILDVAGKSGANVIQGLHFSLRDEQAADTEALRKAVLDARAKAEAIGSALDLKIVRVVSVEESAPLRPITEHMFAAAQRQSVAPRTPVEPGGIDVQARVTMTVEMGR